MLSWPVRLADGLSLVSGGSATISDREVWACAQQLIGQYGERAPVKIAERIGELALKQDVAGIVVWKRIAAAADQLRDLKPQRPRQ